MRYASHTVRENRAVSGALTKSEVLKAERATTSRNTRIIHRSMDARFDGRTQERLKDARLLKGKRKLRQCPLSDATRKTFAPGGYFAF